MDIFSNPKILSSAGNRVQLWNRILKEEQIRTMAEVGVWRGKFAKRLLKQCQFIERYYLVDPWKKLPDWNKPWNVGSKRFDEVYQEAMENVAFAASRVVVLRGRTKEVIDQVPDESLDFAYIDGDHTLRGITIDLFKWLPKIKKGGLLGGDDFTANPWQHDTRFEPTLVCPYAVYFAEAMDLPIAALPFNQFLIRKDASDSFRFLDTTGGKFGDLSLNRSPLGGASA